MCRQNHLWGCAVIAFGLGVIIGMLLESGFMGLCLGFGLMVLGFCILHRK